MWLFLLYAKGYLDWGSVAEEGPSSCLIDADVLIAADVIYDPTANESLALTILHFLRSGEPRSMSPSTTRGSNEAKKRQAIFGITRSKMKKDFSDPELSRILYLLTRNLQPRLTKNNNKKHNKNKNKNKTSAIATYCTVRSAV